MPRKTKEERQEYYRQWKKANREDYNAKELARYHKNKILKGRKLLTDEEKKAQKAAQDLRYREKHKDELRKKKAAYYQKNKSLINKKNIDSLKGDIGKRIAHNLRNRLKMAIKKGSKVGSAVTDLGCSIEDFKLYISSKFQEGMSWDNYGEWHMDHIIPLCSFDLTIREEFLKAAHFSNYQPLWAIDNLAKGGKITNE